MDVFYSFLEKTVPELVEVLEERMSILREVSTNQPIGRRALAERMNLSERHLRNETQILRESRLILSEAKGMLTTSQGEEILSYHNQLSQRKNESKKLEEKLSKKLQIQYVSIVPGNYEGKTGSIEQMGRKTIEVLQKVLPEGKQVIAVMGGTTMAAVADAMNESLSDFRELLFVPARGGIGERTEIQANTIAQRMAENTSAESHTLYLPDQMSTQAVEALIQEPSIKKNLEVIQEASTVVFGIALAKDMFERRHIDNDLQEKLTASGVVGEAFGEFFDKEGEVIFSIPRIGLRFEDLSEVERLIVVAGGAKKAQAITAFLRKAPKHIHLVTDQVAAEEIMMNL